MLETLIRPRGRWQGPGPVCRPRGADIHPRRTQDGPSMNDPFRARPLRFLSRPWLPALLALFLAPAAVAGPPVSTKVLDLDRIDKTCEPCRDFFQYANGGWLKSAEIPAAYSSYGGSEELEDRNREQLRGILEAALKDKDAAPG